MLRALYYRLAPASLRIPVWHLRTGLTQLVRGDPQWRGHLADLYLWRGITVGEVSVDGTVLAVDLHDHGVGRPLYIRREYEVPESAFLRGSLRPGMVFVDAGAHVGYFSTLAARRVGSGGKVVAFEPDPHNFALLTRNLSRNRLDNVLPQQLALGSSAETRRLFFSTDNLGDHRLHDDESDPRRSLAVTVDTLDHALERSGVTRVDAIKLDVQGSELDAVKGGERTLRSNGGIVVLAELWPYGLERAGGSAKELFDFFHVRGFRAHVVKPNGPSAAAMPWPDVEACIPPVDERHPDLAYVNVVFRR